MNSTRALVCTTVLVFGAFACTSTNNDKSGTGGAGTTTTGSTTASTTSTGSTSTGSTSTGTGGTGGTPGPCSDTTPPMEDLGTGADPANGSFTMTEALEGLPDGPGPLRAIIDTEKGTLSCELYPDSAPNGVANFIGLARGRRPWKKGTHWVKGVRFYDGLIFHRVIDNFVAQGGDPKGTGYNGPGYEFADEIDPTKSHVPGTLAYANSGPNTNGSQFYIVAEQPQTGLDGMYVIFGLCSPVDVVKTITEVPTDANDKPITPIHMHVSITRCAP